MEYRDSRQGIVLPMFAAAMPVISREGIRGVIRPDAWLAGEAEGQIAVTFQDGRDYLISTEALHPRLDGGYGVDLSPDQVREIIVIQAPRPKPWRTN